MVNDMNFGEGKFSREATPLILDLKGQILLNWYYASQEVAQREYYVWKGADVHKEEVKKAILMLFISLRGSLENDMHPADFTTIKNTIMVKDTPTTEVIEAFYTINSWLYKKGLTKFDTKQVYNRQRAELSNQHKGY